MFSEYRTPFGARPSGPIGIRTLPLAKPKSDYPIEWKLDSEVNKTASSDGNNVIEIEFYPNRSKRIRHAEWINFHQACRITVYEENSLPKPVKPSDIAPEWKICDRWTTSDYWGNDQDKTDRPSYYILWHPDKGRFVNGNSRSAIMRDEPGFTSHELPEKLLYHKDKNPKGKYIKIRMLFDTFAVCETGKDKTIPQWYEGIRWIWEITAAKYYSGGANAYRGNIFFADIHANGPPNKFSDAIAKYRNVTGKD